MKTANEHIAMKDMNIKNNRTINFPNNDAYLFFESPTTHAATGTTSRKQLSQTTYPHTNPQATRENMII